MSADAQYLSPMVIIPEEIRHALAEKKPVVALESTLIAHGMPWPQNLETALAVENAVRENAAIPVTIGILEGSLIIGLSADQLEFTARHGASIKKCSPRDMAAVLEKGGSGATTVAGTLFSARLAGIDVMATGGIGGVHRGMDGTDVSADLPELAHSPLMLVSAGAKSILDLPATLEFLETLGIPVIGYGTAEFPAFYHRQSGLPLNQRCDTPQEVAGQFGIRKQLGMTQGMLIANPVPIEEEAEWEPVQQALEDSLEEAAQAGLRGQTLTPFLLKRIAEQSGGESLRANIQLVLNNAALGAKLAVAWSGIRKTSD